MNFGEGGRAYSLFIELYANSNQMWREREREREEEEEEEYERYLGCLLG